MPPADLSGRGIKKVMLLMSSEGVIRRGGLQPNITPDETELEFYLRTPTEGEMRVLKQKVVNCIEGAALSTGCKVRCTGRGGGGGVRVLKEKVVNCIEGAALSTGCKVRCTGRGGGG